MASFALDLNKTIAELNIMHQRHEKDDVDVIDDVNTTAIIPENNANINTKSKKSNDEIISSDNTNALVSTYAVPKISFSDLMNRFVELSKLDGGIFFMCDYKDVNTVSNWLHPIPLTIEEM
jgi:hypothetical protein